MASKQFLYLIGKLSAVKCSELNTRGGSVSWIDSIGQDPDRKEVVHSAGTPERELNEDTVHMDVGRPTGTDWWGQGENHWSLASLGTTRVRGGGSITKVDIWFWKRSLRTQPLLHPYNQGGVMNALLSPLPSCLLVVPLVDQSQFLVWGQEWCSPHMSVFRDRV